MEAGASELRRPPWLRGNQPTSAVDLIRFALWRDSTTGTDSAENAEDGFGQEELLAALTLMSAARAELDQAEAGLLFTARAHGLSWPRISRALGLGSPQAAQQRFDRVSGRALGNVGEH
jgi:hypothetical protein